MHIRCIFILKMSAPSTGHHGIVSRDLETTIRKIRSQCSAPVTMPSWTSQWMPASADLTHIMYDHWSCIISLNPVVLKNNLKKNLPEIDFQVKSWWLANRSCSGCAKPRATKCWKSLTWRHLAWAVIYVRGRLGRYKLDPECRFARHLI